MARPRGRIKTARVTVNLDDRAYSALQTIADHEDAPVAQIARRAIMDFLVREGSRVQQPVLPLRGSFARQSAEERR
ncbi:MAG: hypothetical protein F4213_03410 [Boseongicola sp. SB0677_bin_26]|nr:hypothetical protein [Boseongicola sp. SB0665_bin_10]MYG25062.1 hypothetical protein [Boseongicola sp. SB0677_bin_26]